MLTTFERKKVDSHRLYGEIISESEDLILFREEDDFQFDGFRVIRRRDLTSLSTTESNQYCEKLMRKEGLWKKAPSFVRRLPVKNWNVLLTALIGRNVIIENERLEDFRIGPVLDCDEKHVWIHYFDPLGCWMDLERVSLSRITSVQFATRYLEIHSKYLPPRPALFPSRVSR
ncbi:MAG: hypothetical protein U0903_21825 [Planctomycetales bacterium]